MTYTPKIFTEPKAKQTLSAKLRYYVEFMIPVLNYCDFFNPPEIDLLVAIYFASYNKMEHYYITTDQVVAHRVNQYELMANRLLALHSELTDPIYNNCKSFSGTVSHEKGELVIDRLIYYNSELQKQNVSIESIIEALESLGY